MSFIDDGEHADEGYLWSEDRQDVYDDAAYQAQVPYDIDDRPLWEREPAGAPENPEAIGACCRCSRSVPLDPFRECERCRVIGGWCRWCAIERIEYTTLDLGRTCYRWLRRNEDRYSGAEFEARRRRTIERRWAREGL